MTDDAVVATASRGDEWARGLTMSVSGLVADYRAGLLKPSQVARVLLESIALDETPVWITRVSESALTTAARALDEADPSLPLYGVPFAVKDNIDVAGLPTSAGCPGYAVEATETAPVVQRLLDAGALLVGKTNMDQFATGLLGTRSPYGALSSVFDSARVSGGSSSGSALAVARGHVAFALATDTAGSGRVPAAFNELVGHKPTRGLLSTRGAVPACASLDCISVLSHTVLDASIVLGVAEAYDDQDPWSRRPRAFGATRGKLVGVPLRGQGDPEEPAAVRAWSEAREQAGGRWGLTPVDVSPLLDAAPLLYGAWVAERACDLGEVIASRPTGLDPEVQAIIAGAERLRGLDVFEAMHRLASLRRAAEGIWDQVDALLLPTAPSHPTHASVAEDPLHVNERLGRFTNFVNLMDLAALALPGPRRADGLPFGVTLLGPAFSDPLLLELGAAWTGETVEVPLHEGVKLAVVGAHMSGLELNGRLTERGARFGRLATTAPHYRLWEISGGPVRRPGLVRDEGGGASIELEIWELSPAALGALVSEVPAPLAIGRVELAGGEQVTGFVCEGYAALGAQDITRYGGWRAYLAEGPAAP